MVINIYLYVEFADTNGAWIETQMGLPTSHNIRIKRIKLTEEQIKELQPRETGLNTFETVNVICIQDN